MQIRFVVCRWGGPCSKRGPPKVSKYKPTWVALDFSSFSSIRRRKTEDGVPVLSSALLSRIFFIARRPGHLRPATRTSGAQPERPSFEREPPRHPRSHGPCPGRVPVLLWRGPQASASSPTKLVPRAPPAANYKPSGSCSLVVVEVNEEENLFEKGTRNNYPRPNRLPLGKQNELKTGSSKNF